MGFWAKCRCRGGYRKNVFIHTAAVSTPRPPHGQQRPWRNFSKTSTAPQRFRILNRSQFAGARGRPTCEEERMTWNEHMRDSSTVIIAAALSNSPQYAGAEKTVTMFRALPKNS